MPDDHSEVVPLLPIPNRTVKRLCADDSAGSRVKVGHRQALTSPHTPSYQQVLGGLVFLGRSDSMAVNFGQFDDRLFLRGVRVLSVSS